MGNTVIDGIEYRRHSGFNLGSGVTFERENVNVGVPELVTVTANQTLTAADSGKTYVANAADLVFTLPATAKDLIYRFVVKTLSATTGLSVSPVAADKIMGNGFTSANDKDAINTAATDREGDMIEVVGDGVDGWYISAVIGTWARQA